MKKGADMVERYMMIVDIVRSVGMPFEDVVDMSDYEVFSLYTEIAEGRVPNHLGFKR